jgi:hypothetical protein
MTGCFKRLDGAVQTALHVLPGTENALCAPPFELTLQVIHQRAGAAQQRFQVASFLVEPGRCANNIFGINGNLSHGIPLGLCEYGAFGEFVEALPFRKSSEETHHPPFEKQKTALEGAAPVETIGTSKK